MAITIDWLINKSPLNNLKCLTSNNLITNKIESVNILDNPDVLKWIKKDELVITTGYIFKDNEDLQISILKELKQIGCSGLGIKIKRFFESIPDNMIEAADKIGLPIIEIPFYYAFSDISKIIYNELYKENLTLIEDEYIIVNRISNYYFENLGLDYILKELSNIFNISILITDTNFKVLSLGFLPKDNYIIKDYEISQIELSNFSPAMQINSNDSYQESYKRFSINNINFNFYVLFLPNLSGSLCILLDDDEELSFRCSNIIKKVINIISLELERNNNSREQIHYQHNFFFEYLMSNEQKTENEIIKLCNYYGFDYTKKRICINFTLKNVENEYNRKQIFKIINSLVMDTLCNNSNSFICNNNELVCLFIFFHNENNNMDILNDTMEKLNVLCKKLDYKIDYKYKIGVSRCHEGISSIITSFNDCIEAVNLDDYLNRQNRISSFNDQLPYHLLGRLQKNELRKICTDNLQPLINYDNEYDLILILKTYYNCKFNSSETANSLYIHRNTLANRLEKIRNLLNLDFTDYSKVFSIYLSICAYELINISNK